MVKAPRIVYVYVGFVDGDENSRYSMRTTVAIRNRKRMMDWSRITPGSSVYRMPLELFKSGPWDAPTFRIMSEKIHG
jgi:hypothetical protein